MELRLANNWLAVMARHIVKPDSIGIKIVENRQTEFITLSVIGLGSLCPSSVGPIDIIVPLPRRPTNVPSIYLSTGPEVPLPVLSNKTKELPFLSRAVKTDCLHTIGTAEGFPFTLSELGAANSPTN